MSLETIPTLLSSSAAQPLIPGAVNRVKRCRHGYMVYNPKDLFVGSALDMYGEYCESAVDLFKLVIEPGSCVVDVGANIGAHTVVFANAVGPEGSVLAFEPQRLLFQTLAANLAINSLTNVHALPYALGAQPGSAAMPRQDFNDVGNFGGAAPHLFHDGEPVEIRTLDSFQLPQCLLLKIDVEGQELDVLRGAQETIARCQPVIYLDSDNPQTATALKKHLAGLGYRMYWHLTPLFNPDNFFRNTKNVLDIYHSGAMLGQLIRANLLCIHSSVAVPLDQLREATPDDGWHPFDAELKADRFSAPAN